MSDLKIIASYPFLSVAQVAQAALQAEGIPAFFENAEIVNADWLLGNAVGDVKLLVPAEHEAAARDVLATKRLNESRRNKAGSNDNTDRCLACGAALPIESTTCAACGWTFADDAGGVADTPPEMESQSDSVVGGDANDARPASGGDEGLIRSTSWLHHVFLLMLLMILLALYAHSTGYDLLGWFEELAK